MDRLSPVHASELAVLMRAFERLRHYPGVEIEPGFIRGDAGAPHFCCAMRDVRIEFATPFA